MVSFQTPLSPNHHHLHHQHSKTDSEFMNNPSKKRKWEEAVPHHVDYDHVIKATRSSVNLHLEFPLPSDWQRCLDIQSGEVHFYNTRTNKRTRTDPRFSEAKPILNLDLELNSACGDNKSTDKKTTTTLSLFSAETEQQEMVAAACQRCHLLVMLCKTNPACPNCKFMHSTEQRAPNLFKPRLGPSLLSQSVCFL